MLLVSIFLLALITLGAVSAADDNAASVTAVEGDLNLEVPANDEIDAGGDVDSDAAISDNVNDVEDSKLGSSQDEVLKEPVDPTRYIDRW